MPQFGYLTGCLILLVVWIFLYLLKKGLRQELIFGSLLALPFGFSEMLFVHQYWNPPSIFNFIPRFGFGIEDFLFTFVVGGIAAIGYEVVYRNKVIKTKSKSHGIDAYLLFVVIFLGLELVFKDQDNL